MGLYSFDPIVDLVNAMIGILVSIVGVHITMGVLALFLALIATEVVHALIHRSKV